MKSMASQIDVQALIVSAIRTTDNTRIYVDRRGYDSVTIALHIGAGGITFDTSNKIEFKLYEADVSDGSDAALVAEADIINAPSDADATGIFKSLIAAHASAADGKSHCAVTANSRSSHAAGKNRLRFIHAAAAAIAV